MISRKAFTMEEKITFVVPAYNAETTLARTLESILHQTDDRFRIIVINDGSTDSTDEICKDYEKNYPDKITYRYQQNRGLGGARNHGMDLVETEYVSFLDSDDWLMPEYVEQITRQLEKHADENVEIIMTLPEIYHEGSKVVRDWYDKERFKKLFAMDGVIINPQNELEIYQFEVNQCRKVLQMDFVKRISFRFQEKIKWEDVYPHFYLLSQCTTCMGVGSVGFYYRIGAKGQITASRGRDRLDLLTVMQEVLDFIEKVNRVELRFPAMRIFVRFSIWGIRMADMETRKKLVQELHKMFQKIPKYYYTALREGSKKDFSKADARQYRLFMIAIKYKVCNIIFCDYLYQDMGEKMIKKILRAGQRVA